MMVVVRVVIVHCDIRTGAASGLFGFLGDAPVQIVDTASADKVKSYLDFASSCQDKVKVTVRQDFRMPDETAMTERVQDRVAPRHPAVPRVADTEALTATVRRTYR